MPCSGQSWGTEGERRDESRAPTESSRARAESGRCATADRVVLRSDSRCTISGRDIMSRDSSPQASATDRTIALEAVGVSKRYGRAVVALDQLNIQIAQGTITALVGPNGAGKSTLIKAWVGFERPSTGRVTVFGVDPFRDRKVTLPRVAYVAQTAAVYRDLTVSDHLHLVATLRATFDRAYAEQRLVQLGIPLEQRGGDLSGGQKAQLNLALALGTKAEVLLLDEPLANLDPLARREFLHVLTSALRDSGGTALLSSHIVTDIEQACDHLVVLGHGRVLLESGIDVALSSYEIVSKVTSHAATDHLALPVVGSFLDPKGGWVSLVRASPDVERTSRRSRPATLEEVVLGYLASDRAWSAIQATAA